ncbi:hypothetical protein RF11_03673 [Thelohanellus kitauei]|uniref:Uncharacterized protein n=1 Tax=Thelohanellus kitauei TaxID=669202 RepID=A0A0C2MAS0_THEKT|nr:hypothetical protein RF11_03673 [Thelohanellus kitauei]
MSTDSVDKLGKGDSVPLYGLKKTVGPKARVSEVEIHEKAKAGLEAVIDFREAANVLKITEKDSKGRTINKPEELRGSHPIRLIHVKGIKLLFSPQSFLLFITCFLYKTYNVVF